MLNCTLALFLAVGCFIFVLVTTRLLVNQWILQLTTKKVKKRTNIDNEVIKSHVNRLRLFFFLFIVYSEQGRCLTRSLHSAKKNYSPATCKILYIIHACMLTTALAAVKTKQIDAPAMNNFTTHPKLYSSVTKWWKYTQFNDLLELDSWKLVALSFLFPLSFVSVTVRWFFLQQVWVARLIELNKTFSRDFLSPKLQLLPLIQSIRWSWLFVKGIRDVNEWRTKFLEHSSY